MRQNIKCFLITVFIIAIYSIHLHADDLKWDTSAGDVSGYTIYYGLSQGSYSFSEDVGNVTQYSLNNFSLSEGATYYFVVRAYNASGESDDSNVITYAVPNAGDTTPPIPPVGVSGDIVNEDILLTWQANTETDIFGYRVYYGTSSRNYGLPIPVNGTAYSITRLNSDVTYYFAVAAVDSSGNESGYSFPEIMKTIPASDAEGNETSEPYTIVDTTAPVVWITSPTWRSSYGIESDTLSIGGRASDGRGVTRVSWSNSRGGSGTAAGTTSWRASDISLTEGENLITVTARDDAGNTSRDTLTVVYTIPDTPAPVVPNTSWTELTNDNFESGWGSYKDGGSDCRRSVKDSRYAHQGKYSVRIRDNNGKQSSFVYRRGIDVYTPDYSQIKIEFWYLPVSMENEEDFFVEYHNGNRWQRVARYRAGKEFRNNRFYRERIIINKGPDWVFPKNMKIRFRCDASGDGDNIYIDEVIVSAR